jgi:Zn-finger nucleic acid-binding protein
MAATASLGSAIHSSRNQTFGGLRMDLCDRCGGRILDPGEMKVVDRLASSPSTKVDALVDASVSADGVVQLVSMIVKPFL